MDQSLKDKILASPAFRVGKPYIRKMAIIYHFKAKAEAHELKALAEFIAALKSISKPMAEVIFTRYFKRGNYYRRDTKSGQSGILTLYGGEPMTFQALAKETGERINYLSGLESLGILELRKLLGVAWYDK